MFNSRVKALEHAYEVLEEFRTAYETQKECQPSMDSDIEYICNNRNNFYELADFAHDIAKAIVNRPAIETSEEIQKHAITLIDNLIWFYRLCNCVYSCGTIQMELTKQEVEWIKKMREGMPKPKVDLPPGVKIPEGFENFFS